MAQFFSGAHRLVHGRCLPETFFVQRLERKFERFDESRTALFDEVGNMLFEVGCSERQTSGLGKLTLLDPLRGMNLAATQRAQFFLSHWFAIWPRQIHHRIIRITLQDRRRP